MIGLASGETTLLWILLAVGLVGVIYGAYVGAQSLKQAKALGEAVNVSSLGRYRGQVVAVHGRATRCDGATYSTSEKGDWLWGKTRYEVYERSWGSGRNNNARWRTESTEVDAFDFELDDGTGTVTVQNAATEVHGTRYTNSGDYGFFFVANGARRVKRDVLHATSPVTVCGLVAQRGGGGWVIVKDDEAGMLLSSKDPAAQAQAESLKGWAGVVGGPLAWIALLCFVLFGT